ncbi:MAG: C-terminal binding protein [Chloroflexi bacterium]|nr:C-terminal binding protein [Chloroflexota bacterium]
MPKQKIVIFGRAGDPLTYERAEFADLSCEIIQADPKSEGEAMEIVKDADAIMGGNWWQNDRVISAAEKCQVLAVYSHGFNHVDVDACTMKGIIVTNSAGMCAEEVSNQAIAFLFALNRQVTWLDRRLKGGTWDAGPYRPKGTIDEEVLGIIGFGNIGRAIGRKMSGWRMKTIVHDPYVGPWMFKDYGVEPVAHLNDIFSRSDYVIVVVPLNKETYHMIGAEQFKLMKKTAFFINVCRGSVVNEPDLIKALQEKWFAGAGLDVFEKEPGDLNNPIFKLDNVVVAPHVAGSSLRSAVLSRQRASQQVKAVLQGYWPMAGQNSEVRANIPLRRNAKTAVS